jgi:hypothetical protein
MIKELIVIKGSDYFGACSNRVGKMFFFLKGSS